MGVNPVLPSTGTSWLCGDGPFEILISCVLAPRPSKLPGQLYGVWP